jgi:hypothetical protein
MGRRIRTGGLLLGLILTTATGCQPVHYEKTYTLEPGLAQAVTFDAPRFEQKITVKVSSPGAPVSVYLVKAADGDAAIKAAARKGPEVLARQEKSEDVSFEATIPAKTPYAVVLESEAKKAEAKLKVNGK